MMATFPDLSHIIFDQLIVIAQFDLVPTDMIYIDVLKMEIPDNYDEYMQKSFSDVKYESTYMIMNLGSLYLVLLFMILQVILLPILRPLKAISPRFSRWHSSVSKTLFWNGFLRLILEAALDFSIAMLINLNAIYELNSRGNTDWWLPHLPFFWLNYLTVGFAALALFVGPIFLLIFYTCRYKSWTDDKFEQRFGAVLDGLRKDTRMSIFYPAFFMIRRTVFALQAVFAPTYFSMQLIV